MAEIRAVTLPYFIPYDPLSLLETLDQILISTKIPGIPFPQPKQRNKSALWLLGGRGREELEAGSQKVQTSSYMVNKYEGYNA